MKRIAFLLTSTAAALALTACGQKEPEPQAAATAPVSAQCGKVKVANMTWQSAEVLANVDQIILSVGYGCDVELVPGDTMPTLTSMPTSAVPKKLQRNPLIR